jgi:hypothetical protein
MPVAISPERKMADMVRRSKPSLTMIPFDAYLPHAFKKKIFPIWGNTGSGIRNVSLLWKWSDFKMPGLK